MNTECSELLVALKQSLFAIEAVLYLAGGSLKPAAAEELATYANAARAAIAKAEGFQMNHQPVTATGLLQAAFCVGLSLASLVVLYFVLP